MTLHTPRRAVALILMLTLVGSTFARGVYADDAPADTGSAPVADTALSVPAASTDSSTSDTATNSSTDTAITAPTDSSSSASDTSSSEDSTAVSTEQQATTLVSDTTTTNVDDSVSASTTSESSTETDTQTSVTTNAPEGSVTTTTATNTPPVTIPTETLDVPAAPSGTSIATTSTIVAPTSTVATTSTATSTQASTTPTILSGQAVAVANILNIVNTNIVNSQGALVLGNFFDPQNGTIDLRAGNPFGSLACDLLSCDAGGITVNVGNNATIDNAIALSATSGGNDITSNTDGVIGTGNAFAGLNLVNLANTNIVDSNYLLVTLNAFQGINGDIVFPSLTNFLSQLAGGVSGTFSVDPTADVRNDITTNADSGGNSTDASSSAITTGSAQSTGNVFNSINMAELGAGNVSILFRVQGNWAGQIFGAPTGLNWTRGTDGSIFLFGDPSLGGTGVLNADITGSSTAHINNDVNVVALTGDNRITAPGSALITTGNALAGANVVNVANTNVVGRNWILAVVNVFGDFNGNIAFGRPDLWVGEQVNVPSFLQEGSDVTYTYTVINNGDSTATNAVLKDTQDMNHMTISNPSVPYTVAPDGSLEWQLGAIPAGQAMVVSYHATLNNTQPGTSVTNSVSVGETETDNNTADNSDTATITLSTPSSGSFVSAPFSFAAATDVKPFTVVMPDLSGISVTRGTESVTSTRGEKVHETLTVKNTGSGASPALTLHDILRDPSGAIIQDQSGDIGVLAPGDEVTIGYDLSFADDAPAGTYTFSTVIDAGDQSALADHNGTLILKGDPQVQGASASVAHPSVRSLAKTVAGSFTTQVAHASEGNLAASVANAGISWQLGLFLLLVTALALGAGLTAMRMRRRLQSRS